MRVQRRILATCLGLATLFLSPSLPGADGEPSSAYSEKEEAEYTKEHPLGRLVLHLTPGARVTAGSEIDEGVFRLTLSDQREPVGPQVSQRKPASVSSFSVVPVSSSSIRIDFRLSPAVKGVSLVKGAGDRLEVRFEESSFAGGGVHLRGPDAVDEVDGAGAEPSALQTIIESPTIVAPTFVHWPPLYFGVGFESPIRKRLPLKLVSMNFGRVPDDVRQGWNEQEQLKEAALLIERGDLQAASKLISTIPADKDSRRALIALARAHLWSQPGADGEPLNAGWAADAFGLAAGLRPRSSWVPWARGKASAYHVADRHFQEAVVQAERAIKLAPEHPDRAYWEIALGQALLHLGRTPEGVAMLIEGDRKLPDEDRVTSFHVRRSAAYGLWVKGEATRASRIVDLLLEENPGLARLPGNDEIWSRIYLDAGRSAAALPFLERLESEGAKRIDRIRARWWLHEAALTHREVDLARTWLREILEKSPDSTLAPLARLRLQLMDLLATDEKEVIADLRWQVVAMELRNIAYQWPHTVIEDEALSSSAQLFIGLELLEDGLNLYRWIEDRTPSTGGALAYEEIVCRTAPRLFDQLRSRGHVTRALGIYRGFLDDVRMHACVDPRTRAEAAATALAAGLPDLGATWLGRAIAEGAGGPEAAENLIQLASIYLAEGKVNEAEKTLEYIESAALPAPQARKDSAWGDIRIAQGQYDAAMARFDRAIDWASESMRTRAAVPSLRYRRGIAAEKAGDLPAALDDLLAGVREGGADDQAEGWFHVATVASQLGRGKVDWTTVLEACEEAEVGADSAYPKAKRIDRSRGISWYRAHALTRLGRAEEAQPLLAALGGGGDTWGLLARELQDTPAFAAAVRELATAPSER